MVGTKIVSSFGIIIVLVTLALLCYLCDIGQSRPCNIERFSMSKKKEVVVPEIAAVLAHSSATFNETSAEQQGLNPASHLSVVADFGVEIVRGTLKVGETYFKLCSYIRANKVAAETVRDALEPLGFIKQRITEINRVAMAPGELWSEYEARALSFRRTLELSRGTVQLLLDKAESGAESNLLTRTMVGVEAEESEGEVAATEKEADGNASVTPPETAQVKKQRMEAAATKLGFYAEKYSVKSRMFKLENGYVVTVSRSKTKAAKVVGAPE